VTSRSSSRAPSSTTRRDDSIPFPLSLPAATVDEQGVRTPSKTFAQTVFVRPGRAGVPGREPDPAAAVPFDMTVVMRITATSDSGDTFDTNEISYAVGVLAPPL
jgi:hypothetical protein